ncbi:hypothetical protein AOLI_G00200710 [Acnodon oligacanthus]
MQVKTLAHLYSCGNDPASAAYPDKSMGNAENGEMSAGHVLPWEQDLEGCLEGSQTFRSGFWELSRSMAALPITQPKEKLKRPLFRVTTQL